MVFGGARSMVLLRSVAAALGVVALILTLVYYRGCLAVCSLVVTASEFDFS